MMSKKMVFLCQCGNNVSNYVDLPKLEAWAKEQPDVEFVTTHGLLCSPGGKAFVEQAIRERKPDQVVIAACSPKMHLKTFEACAENAGLNGAMVQMANIREQCGWVTPDLQESTDKARSLIQAALNRVELHEAIEPRSMECLTDIVVIGGGIAGIEAALMAADAGRKVTIVEKEISLGGELIKVEEIAPQDECAPCMLAPRLAAVTEHANIKVISNAEVLDVLGFLGNFTVVAKKKARFVNDTCIGCEACFEVCPESMVSGFHLGLGTHKAIYTQFPGSVPAMAAIDADHCLHLQGKECNACVEACPFGSIDFAEKDEVVEVQCGAVVIASGADVHVPADLPRLGHGQLDNVLTLAEFERLGCSNGPTGGKVQLKSGEQPQSLAVLHCAGSLCEGGLSYCSGVCCQNAMKAGGILRKQVPTAQVTNIHDRLVFPSAAGETFLHHQVHAGTKMLRCNALDQVQVKQAGAQLEVVIPGAPSLLVDMVVLSTGLKASQSTRDLAAKVNADLDTNGFFRSDHLVINQTGSTIDGVGVAGSCLKPAHAPESVTQGKSAVGKFLSTLVPGKRIELETMVSVIDADLCAGCKLCISSCPYKAIGYNLDQMVSQVNEAICRGCGTCASTCPSGAVKSLHFTNQQILAEVKGVLHG